MVGKGVVESENDEKEDAEFESVEDDKRLPPSSPTAGGTRGIDICDAPTEPPDCRGSYVDGRGSVSLGVVSRYGLRSPRNQGT